MKQNDLFGGAPPPDPFKDIGNQRPSAAEEKASLCLQLGRLCLKVPHSVSQGSIEQTRAWVAAQKVSLALVKNSRASAPQLTAAIANMRRFLVDPAIK